MDKILELLTQTQRDLAQANRDLGKITSDIKHIRQNNNDVKSTLEELIKADKISSEAVENLKKEVDEHSIKIEELQKEIDKLRSSADRYNKFDAKITKTKKVISYITFNNVFMQVILSGLVYAILVMLVAMFIDYISIRMGFSEEVIEQIKSGLDRR